MNIIKVPQERFINLQREVSSKVGVAYVVHICTLGIHLLNPSWCKSAQNNWTEVSHTDFNICWEFCPLLCSVRLNNGVYYSMCPYSFWFFFSRDDI